MKQKNKDRNKELDEKLNEEELVEDEYEEYEEEESGSAYDKISAFAQKYKKYLFGISIAVIVIVGLIFLFKKSDGPKLSEDEMQASYALSRVARYYQMSDYNRALYGDTSKQLREQPVLGLIEIINKWGDTKPGQVAALYAGNALMLQGKYTEAIDYFNKALNSKSNVVLESANGGIGASQEYMGNTAEALKSYEKASTVASTPLSKNKYQYFTAKCCEKLGGAEDKQKAEKLFREIISENKSKEFVDLAKAGLVRLGTIIE